MSSPQKEIKNSSAADIPSSLEVICDKRSHVSAAEETDSGSVYIISSESAEPECIYISSESKEEHRIPAEAKSCETLDIGSMKPLLLSTPKPVASE